MSSTTSNIIDASAEEGVLPQNIFVTQINESINREDEYENGIIKHPIIKDSPSKLLKNGLNTFQNTLVVKKENEVRHLDSDLLNKRLTYDIQMKSFRKKKQELIKKQQLLLDQMKSFDSFIKENDAKRKRALVKYHNEIRIIEQQKRIQSDLKEEIRKTKILHEKLLKKVRHNKKYEEFLLKVIEILPPDYIKVTENVLGGLIMRYNTLYSTNELLLSDMSNKAEENHYYASLITKLQEDNNKELLKNNYQLSHLYKEHERLKEQFGREEQQYKIKHGDICNEILNFGLILRSIENINTKCARRFDETVSDEEIEAKLDRIKNFIITSKQIVEIVNQTKEKSCIQLTTQKPVQDITLGTKSRKSAKDKLQ